MSDTQERQATFIEEIESLTPETLIEWQNRIRERLERFSKDPQLPEELRQQILTTLAEHPDQQQQQEE